MNGDVGTAAPSKKGRGYHHGNLRQALIEAGIWVLDNKGVDALTLRDCAARAGVSHAAPSHHFGNLEGLRTALATMAFQLFHDTIAAEQAKAGTVPVERLRAAGRAYLRFAISHPGLFRLMFGAGRLNREEPDFQATSAAAYEQLGDTVRPFLREETPAESARLRLLVWSTAHGYAHLFLEGRFRNLGVSADGLSHLPDLAALVSK